MCDKLKKLKKLIEKNNLFFKITITAVAGIFISAAMISAAAVEMSHQIYTDAFCSSNRQVTERVAADINDFYTKINGVINTVNKSWAFRSYLDNGYDPYNSVRASNILYSMNKHIETAFEGISPNDMSVVVIGNNDKTYVSGSSLLIKSAEEIIQSDFTEKLDNSENIVSDFKTNGMTTAVYDGNTLVFGKKLDCSNENNQSYIYVSIPQRVLLNFYKELNNNAMNRVIIGSNGTVISCENPDYIGIKSEKLLEVSKLNSETEQIYNEFSSGNKKYSAVSVYIPSMDIYITDIIDNNVIIKSNSSRNIIIFLSLAVSSVTAAIIFALIKRSTKPIYILVEHMSEVSAENICHHISIENPTYEIRKLEEAYNIMADNTQHYIEQLMDEQDKRRNAEINMLQLQINPHFIYNTLTSVKWLVMQHETEKSVEAIERFSLLLRSTLKNPDEFVTIKNEAENLKNYIYILNLRFGDRIKTNIFVSENCCEYKIPLLLIQPFVENAFYHGFNETGTGIISVFFNKKHDNIVIEVMDNGSGMDKPAGNIKKKDYSFGGVGLSNSKERLRLIYGNNADIQINSSKGKGTCITITFPAEK